MGRTLLDGLDVLGSEQPRPTVLDAHVEVPGEPCHTGFVEAELIGHLPGGLEVGLPHAGQDTGWGPENLPGKRWIVFGFHFETYSLTGNIPGRQTMAWRAGRLRPGLTTKGGES